MATSTPLTYRCPHCQTLVHVEIDQVDTVVRCPSVDCGRLFRPEIPQIKDPVPESAADADMAPAAAPIERAETAAEPAEKDVYEAHMTMWRRFPLRALLYSLLVLGGGGLAIHGLVEERLWFAVTGGVLAAFGLLRIFLWWLRIRNTVFKVTNKRCVVETGVVSKQVNEVLRDDISDIHVMQGNVDRILNVGDVVIVSNGGEKKQFVLMGVHDPERLACKLRDNC